MELPPEIVGRSSLPPSAVATRSPSTPPRSLPPPFDSTFAWMPPSRVETTSPAPMPAVAEGRGMADTLLSAPWFGEVADASERRAIAEERRAGGLVAVSAPTATPFPVWIVAAVVAGGVTVSAGATGVLALVVSAFVLFV